MNLKQFIHMNSALYVLLRDRIKPQYPAEETVRLQAMAYCLISAYLLDRRATVTAAFYQFQTSGLFAKYPIFEEGVRLANHLGITDEKHLENPLPIFSNDLNNEKFHEIFREALEVFHRVALSTPSDTILLASVWDFVTVYDLKATPVPKVPVNYPLTPCRLLTYYRSGSRLPEKKIPLGLMTQYKDLTKQGIEGSKPSALNDWLVYFSQFYRTMRNQRVGVDYPELLAEVKIFYSLLVKASKSPSFKADFLWSRFILGESIQEIIDELKALNVHPTGASFNEMPFQTLENESLAYQDLEFFTMHFRNLDLNFSESKQNSEKYGDTEKLRQVKFFESQLQVLKDYVDLEEGRLTTERNATQFQPIQFSAAPEETGETVTLSDHLYILRNYIYTLSEAVSKGKQCAEPLAEAKLYHSLISKACEDTRFGKDYPWAKFVIREEVDVFYLCLDSFEIKPTIPPEGIIVEVLEEEALSKTMCKHIKENCKNLKAFIHNSKLEWLRFWGTDYDPQAHQFFSDHLKVIKAHVMDEKQRNVASSSSRPPI